MKSELKYLGVAFWFITPDQKVLLQPKKLNETVIYEPIEGWVTLKPFKPSEIDRDEILKNVAKKLLGEDFANVYPFHQLFLIGKINFFDRYGAPGVRYHYCGSVTKSQLGLIEKKIEFILVGKEDKDKIKRLSEKRLSETNKNSDIVLSDEKYWILTKEVLFVG